MGVSYIAVGNIVEENSKVTFRQMGGSALYAATGAHIWSRDTGVQGNIPDDFPAELLAEISQAGLDLSGVRRLSHLADPKSAMNFDSLHPVKPNQIPESYWTILGCHLTPAPFHIQIALAQAFHHREALVSMDPGSYLRTIPQERLAELLSEVSVLLIHKRDLEGLFPDVDSIDAVFRLSEYGPSVICVRNGGEGSWVLERKRNDHWVHVPALSAHISKFEGCEHAFCGGFLVGMVENQDAVIAARYGAVSASILHENMDIRKSLRSNRYQAAMLLDQMNQLAPSDNH